MLKDIYNNPIEILRYLKYNKVAVRLTSYIDWLMFDTRINTKVYFKPIHYNSTLFSVDEQIKHWFTLYEKDYLYISLYVDKQGYNHIIFITDRGDLYDKAGYTIVNMDQLVTTSKSKVTIKIPTHDTNKIST
jgi:hypothetical protein